MTAVIFDLDGTLVDSAPDIHAAVTRLLMAEGEAPLDFPTVKRFIGNGVPTLIARVMSALGREGEGLHARWLARFMEDYAQGATDLTQPYPGVVEALEALAAEGHGLAICTNKPEEPARHVLAAFGLTRFFPVVVGGDSLAVRKPDPAPLRAAAAGLGSGRDLCRRQRGGCRDCGGSGRSVAAVHRRLSQEPDRTDRPRRAVRPLRPSAGSGRRAALNPARTRP